MIPQITFRMSHGERESDLWKRLRNRLEQMLAKERALNDDPNSTEQQTAARRGHIECLKAVIRLGNERPNVEDDDDAAEEAGRAA